MRRRGAGRYLMSFFPNPAMPEPVGHPDRGNIGGVPSGTPNCTGGGETDWTLVALHTAAASLAGPETSLLVGMAPGGTLSRRGKGSRTSPRFIAWASRAVSDCSPKVDSMNFRVEVCSKGPSWMTRAEARFEITMAGTRNPSCV